MSPSPINIKEGAFLISDAHYSVSRPQLLDFLKAIDSKKLKPNQLIFMGDIFDTLFGAIKRTYTINQEAIDLINKISKEIEVIYLEGNHDFNLKSIFENTKVFTIQKQPVEFSLENKKLYLAHGDFVGTTTYKIYTTLIRSKIMLFLLSMINAIFNNYILRNLDEYLSKKKDCTTIKNFENIIKDRLENKYECDYFVEGHFHQNKHMKFEGFEYFNLAAFACNQRYFIVKSSHKELFIEKIFSKGI